MYSRDMKTPHKTRKATPKNGKSLLLAERHRVESHRVENHREDGHSQERMKIIAGYVVGSLLFIGIGVAFHSPSAQRQSMSSQEATQEATDSAHTDNAKKEKCIKIDGYPEASQWHAHDGCEEAE